MQLHDPRVSGQRLLAGLRWATEDLADGGGGEVEVPGEDAVTVLGALTGVEGDRAAGRSVVRRQPDHVPLVALVVHPEHLGHPPAALRQDRVVQVEPAAASPLDHRADSRTWARRLAVHLPSSSRQGPADLVVASADTEVPDRQEVVRSLTGDHVVR